GSSFVAAHWGDQAPDAVGDGCSGNFGLRRRHVGPLTTGTATGHSPRTGNGVDVDAFGGEVDGKLAGQVHHGALGGAIAWLGREPTRPPIEGMLTVTRRPGLGAASAGANLLPSHTLFEVDEHGAVVFVFGFRRRW